MKYLKLLAVTIIALFAFEGAKAQVVVRTRVAPVHQRTVVTTRPVYRHAYRRTVVATRPVVYHRPYHRTVVVTRPAYRRTVAYHRPYKRVVVRRY
ncbi:hypothetical protein IDJ77_25165 [Mucilaginibacter sp. ZT4R22]|uniref:Uncharacterized protein n=1 Tax=Mucilaginibacter pankratovii TaxID=2772110 RepID=A0ABR7WXV3_9SPHI|nr:hypothetical protein [Mucilaginibacter pankratovii]MBD1367126.1 hypothetical protein [Mucilaginibacter pankratovii]